MAAVLAGAAEPDQVVLACAVVGALVGCRHAQRSIDDEPLVALLLSLLLLRYGSYQSRVIRLLPGWPSGSPRF